MRLPAFPVSNKDLLKVLDGILEAKAPAGDL
jgi:hypothetical protein